MNYDQKRKYFICKYNRNPNFYQCRHFYNKMHSIKSYIINNPIGYVYKNKLRRPLSVWYDRETRKYNYYVIDYFGKKPDGDDTIIHTIENKGLQLYDGDSIYVPSRGKMKVKVYNLMMYGNPYNPMMYGNSYNSLQMYGSQMYGLKWRIVGYVTLDESKKKKFYKLYEQEYIRDTFRYKIELYPGFYLDVVNPQSGKYSRTEDRYRFRNRLYNGDIIKIETMNKNYRVHIYEYDDIY